MLCVASLLKMWSKVPSHDALFPWASTCSLHVFCCGFAACYHPELAVIQDGFENDCCASCNINTGRTFYLGRESTITTMSAMKRERSPANVLKTEHAVCKPSISHWTCCFARFSQEDNSLVGHPLPLSIHPVHNTHNWNRVQLKSVHGSDRTGMTECQRQQVSLLLLLPPLCPCGAVAPFRSGPFVEGNCSLCWDKLQKGAAFNLHGADTSVKIQLAVVLFKKTLKPNPSKEQSRVDRSNGSAAFCMNASLPTGGDTGTLDWEHLSFTANTYSGFIPGLSIATERGNQP